MKFLPILSSGLREKVLHVVGGDVLGLFCRVDILGVGVDYHCLLGVDGHALVGRPGQDLEWKGVGKRDEKGDYE